MGTAISRPQRGQIYGGITSMEGPFSSTLLVGAVSYRLSHKWILDLAGTYDLGPTGNIGERLAITHVGESLLVRIEVSMRTLVATMSVRALPIEPRFMPKGRLGRIGEMPIPPLGTMGIE